MEVVAKEKEIADELAATIREEEAIVQVAVDKVISIPQLFSFIFFFFFFQVYILKKKINLFKFIILKGKN